jgi:hypothetical protein
MAKRAWLIFFILGVGTVLAAPINLIGRPPDPPSPEATTGLTLEDLYARTPGLADFIPSISRQLGNFMLAAGVLLAAIAAGPFRRGERWAWTTMWIVPVMLAIQFANSRFGRGWQFDGVLIPVTISALLATTRPRPARPCPTGSSATSR